jgi:multidrug efflux system membrane fusion protein
LNSVRGPLIRGEFVIHDKEGVEAPAPVRERRTLPRKYAIALIVVAAVLLLALLIARNLQHKAPGAPPAGGRGGGGQNGPVPVSVATAAYGDIQLRIPALGTVTPLATVTVRTQISGILQKIAFTEGQLVRQGDLIAQIDPRPYEAAVQQMQGNLARDQALLADARLDLKRYEGLVKEDSIAVQQLDTQRALVDQYIGTTASDEGQLKTAQVNLIYTHIVSPISGRVGLRQVDQGNYVTPGDANGIVVINQVQPITVIFPVPEDNVPAIAKRLRAQDPMTVEAYDRGNSAKLADGKLLTLDNAIDTTTGTVKLRALFDNADGALFPNQFVNIQLLQELLQHQIIIPNAAVRRGAPNGVVTTFVYVVKPDRTVAVRPVTLGVVDGERAAIASGLAAGEVVVTEGGDRLREGAQVTLPQATQARPTAATPGSTPPAGALPGAAKGTRRQRPHPNPSQ